MERGKREEGPRKKGRLVQGFIYLDQPPQFLLLWKIGYAPRPVARVAITLDSHITQRCLQIGKSRSNGGVSIGITRKVRSRAECWAMDEAALAAGAAVFVPPLTGSLVSQAMIDPVQSGTTRGRRRVGS